MDEAPAPAAAPPPPRPALRTSTKISLAAAMLLSGAAAGGVFLPWHVEQIFADEESRLGWQFVEGIAELAVGGLGFMLFLAALLATAPKARSGLAAAAVCTAILLAFLPLEVIFRASWLGVRTVVEIGGGYSGWARGLYLSLASGFAAAGVGSIAAAALARRSATPPAVKPRLARKPPKAGTNQTV